MRTNPPAGSSGPARQRDIFLAGVAGRRPVIPVDATQLEERARTVMSAESFAYTAGGAGAERTMAANRAAFDRWRIVPRVLRDVSARDTSITLFDQPLVAPLLLAPIGVLELAHHDADLAVARAAAAERVPMIFSNQASVPMEQCAAAMGDAPRWFQLYWSRSDDLVRSFVRRAEASGCGAIVLTLDTTLLGWRPRDLDLGHLPFLHGKGIAQYTSDPVFRASLGETGAGGQGSGRTSGDDAPARLTLSSLRAFASMVRRYPGPLGKKLRSGEPRAAVQRFVETYSRPSLTWDDLSFLRDLTRLPILLKGVLHPDDAREAIARGMDGIIVSNHGGRQVDGAIASLDALPAIVDAVQGRVPVLLDSGIRTGADVFKALASGATAVCIGRPWVYGLALGGEAGVRDVIRNIRAELDLTMGLAGCGAISEITRESLSGGQEPGARR